MLIDRVTSITSASGVMAHLLGRSENVVWEETVDPLVHRSLQPCEAPENPDIEIDTSRYDLDEAADYVAGKILGFLDGAVD